MNLVILTGNLGRDAEEFDRYVKFSIATSDSKKVNDEWVKVSTWHNIVLFGAYGASIAKFLKKGAKVAIQGKISISDYLNKDGVKVKSFSIIANQVEVINYANDNEDDKNNDNAESKEKLAKQNEFEDDIPF